MKEILRLFIAVTFTEEIKDNLGNLVKILKDNTLKGHFTHRDNFHLTLAFIGETKEKEKVMEAMELAIENHSIPPFYLKINGFGRFRGRDGDIYWAGTEENPVLTELNRVLIHELQKQDFKPDDKKFKPHLTLGRGVVLKKGYEASDFEKEITPMVIQVNSIELMKSERIQGKLVYTEIYRKEFME